ncbi:MAG: hypothetical protein Fur0023_01660 [Bacteroidia bacterium]
MKEKSFYISLKQSAKSGFLLILFLGIIVALDRINVNDKTYSVQYIQDKIKTFENNIETHSRICKDVLIIEKLDKPTITALADWGIYDVNDIFTKHFLVNNTGWYWVIHKQNKYYVLKFKYLYPVNNQYLREHYSECLDIPDALKMTYSEKAQLIPSTEGFLPVEISEYPKYKHKFLVNINAVFLMLWFLWLYYFLLQLHSENWWRIAALALAFLCRWLLYRWEILRLLNESFFYDVRWYAFPSVFFMQYFGDVIVSNLSFLIYLFFETKYYNKKTFIFKIALLVVLLFITVYVFIHHSGFSLTISDILFYDYHNWFYSVLALMMILILVLCLSYELFRLLDASQNFYRFIFVSMSVLALVSFFIFQEQQKLSQEKTEYIFNQIESEDQIALFDQCQLIDRELNNLNTLNDTIYFNKISRIENTSIYLQLSKRFLFEDSSSLHYFLKDKKQILNNIFIEQSVYVDHQNSSIENIYYINKVDKKYLLTAFEYTLPFNNKYYAFLSDKIFQSSSGFKNFHIAVYTNNRLKFKSGQISFPPSLDELQAFQNIYPDFIYHNKNIEDKNIVVAYTRPNIKHYISLFSSYFIATLTLFLIFVYFHFALKYKHLFPIRFLSFSQKIMLLVILISVVSFYFLFWFSYQYIQKIFSENIKTSLLKEYHTFDFQSNKNKDILIYNKDGYLNNTSAYHPLIKFKLLPARLPDAIIENATKNKLYFHKRKIGDYEYTSLFAIKDKHIVELSYYDEVYDKEINLNNLLNPLFNVYALFFVISFFIGIVLSDYIVYPIRKIAGQLSKSTHPLHLNPLSYPYNDELGELVKNYNTLIEQLQTALEQLKKEQQEKAWKLMAQQVAHDIKNSLTPLLLNVEYLRKKLQNSAQDTKTLASIQHQIELLARTADDFSELAQDIPVKKEKVHLPTLVKKIISQYEHYPEITIRLSESCSNCEVETDAHLLSRVLINLINNAIDALEGKGHIELEIKNIDNHYTLISVKDNGSGIPADIRDKIFEPKFSTKTSGKGLGLFIVKNICDKLHIAISFESQENQGTVFYLTIKNN